MSVCGPGVWISVLGHIFEQSISDLEALTELVGQEHFELAALSQQIHISSTSVTGKRKLEGVIYTSYDITAFIVTHTLGAYIDMRREETHKSYLSRHFYSRKHHLS